MTVKMISQKGKLYISCTPNSYFMKEPMGRLFGKYGNFWEVWCIFKDKNIFIFEIRKNVLKGIDYIQYQSLKPDIPQIEI